MSSDLERLKELERRYASERDNASLREEIIRLRQRLGMTESGTIARKQDPVLMERFKAALGKKKKLTKDDAIHLIGIYFRFHGYSVDRHGSYVKGSRKHKVMSRNLQSFRGGPGNWVKIGSESLIDFATRIAAIVLAEDEDSAGRKLSLVNREKKVKAADKKSKEKERLLSYDIALAMISSSLTPRERKDVLLYQAENEWKLPGGLVSEIEDSQRQVLDELNHGVKMSPSDISNIVSLRNPPILFPNHSKRPDKIHWKHGDIDITVSFDGRTSDYMNANRWLYAISFGNSGIDPFTLRFRSETAAYLGDKTNVLSGGIMQDYYSKNVHGFVSFFVAPKDGQLDNLFKMAGELFDGYGLSTYELIVSQSEYRDIYDLIDRKVIHVSEFHRDNESGDISRITVLTRGGDAPGQGYLFENMRQNPEKTRSFFHVCRSRSVPSIMKNGLIPKIGENSALAGEDKKAVFFFQSMEDLESGIESWLEDAFEEDEELTILKVDLPLGFPVHPTFQEDYEKYGQSWEFYTYENVPAKFISIHGDL